MHGTQGEIARIISIHAPPRGATCTAHRAKSPASFQFTPLREGRPADYGAGSGGAAISIHAPPRGATRPNGAAARNCPISIHAPPRGATEETSDKLSENQFQFTPLREGRPCPFPACRTCTRFQFTPLREGRRMPYPDAPKEESISIHAPPRGATDAIPGRAKGGKNFNSRPSARGDHRSAVVFSRFS